MDADMIAFELRTYQIAPDRMDAITEIMRELVEPLMREYAMKGVGYWCTPDLRTLYWIVEHGGVGDIDNNWDRFHADQRWKDGLAARHSLEPIVTQVASTPLLGRNGLPPLGS